MIVIPSSASSSVATPPSPPMEDSTGMEGRGSTVAAPNMNGSLQNAAVRLSRKQQIEAMTIKRKGNFSYLQKVHNGNAYWLNCVLLSNDFMRYALCIDTSCHHSAFPCFKQIPVFHFLPSAAILFSTMNVDILLCIAQILQRNGSPAANRGVRTSRFMTRHFAIPSLI